MRAFVRYVDLRYFALYTLLWGILLIPYRGDLLVMKNLLGGVRVGYGIEAVQLGRWLLFLSPCLLTAAHSFSIAQNSRIFSLYRIGRLRWWFGICASVLMEIAAFLMIGLFMMRLLCGEFSFFPAILLTAALHLCFLAELMLVLFAVTKKLLPAVLSALMLDGFSHILTVGNPAIAKYFIGTWGMAIRSDLYTAENAFSLDVVLPLQLLLMVLMAFFTPTILKEDR